MEFEGGSDPVLIGPPHLLSQVTVLQMTEEAAFKEKKVRKR